MLLEITSKVDSKYFDYEVFEKVFTAKQSPSTLVEDIYYNVHPEIAEFDLLKIIEYLNVPPLCIMSLQIHKL